MHLLTLAIFLPALFALIVLFIPSRMKGLMKFVTLIGTLVTFGIVTAIALAYPGEVSRHDKDGGVENPTRLDFVMANEADRLREQMFATADTDGDGELNETEKATLDLLRQALKGQEEYLDLVKKLRNANLKNPFLAIHEMAPDDVALLQTAFARDLGLEESADWSGLAAAARGDKKESIALTDEETGALEEAGAWELYQEVTGLEAIQKGQLFDSLDRVGGLVTHAKTLAAHPNQEAYELYTRIREAELASRSSQAPTLAFVKHMPWIGLFNINYFVGVDGLSLPLIWLTALLLILCIVYSWNIENINAIYPKAFFSLFLLLETGLIGVFASLDFFLFYVFWEIVLLPMYFLVGIWGGKDRIYAAIKFFIYTLVGSVLMLIALLALYFQSGLSTFNTLTLTELVPWMGYGFQWWIFIALFVGFAIKVPVFPFHTWLPAAHVQAPTAGSMVLAGILLKMGGYGFFRFSYPLCPEIAVSTGFVYFISGLGMINIVYGALVAMAQTDFKKLVAYSSVSHMGYVLLGLAAVTYTGTAGGVLQMINHGLSSAMLFALVGILKDHYEPRFIHRRPFHKNLKKFDGMALHMPYYAGWAILGFFASLGLPGLNGFISEALCFLGVYHEKSLVTAVGGRWIVYVSLSGVVLTAAYLLWTVQRVYLGEKNKDKVYDDLTFQEWVTLVPLGLLCVILGVWPSLILDYMDPSLKNLLAPVLEFAQYAGH